MKAKYFAVAAAALLSAACFTSCSNDEVMPEEVQTVATGWPKVIHVNFEKSAATRLLMGGQGYTPVWEEYAFVEGTLGVGDYLTVVSVDADGKETRCRYTCTDPANNEFTLDQTNLGDTPVGPYTVVYSGRNMPSIGELGRYINVKSSYDNISQAKNDISNAWMVGTADDLTQGVTMKNIMALLKFSIPENETIYAVRLNTSAQPGFAGSGVYDCQESTYSFTEYSYTNSIGIGRNTYSESEGESAEDILPLEPGVHYIPMLPQTLEISGNDYLDLSYTNLLMNMGNVIATRVNMILSPWMIKTFRGKFELEAGKVYDLGELSLPANEPVGPGDNDPETPTGTGIQTTPFVDGTPLFADPTTGGRN